MSAIEPDDYHPSGNTRRRRHGRRAVGCLTHVGAWIGGLLASVMAVVGLVLLVSGFNGSHACTLYPTGSACRSATPHEVLGVLLLVVGILGAVGAVRSTR